MAETIPRISAVTVRGDRTISVTWDDRSSSEIDLTDWIESGAGLLSPLEEPAVFARAAVGAFGGNVTWDGDTGDLAIDSLHLKRISREQSRVATAA